MTNYAILGPYDYLDICQAPYTETAFKVATLIRTLGHAQTEVWSGIERAKFKDMVRSHHEDGGEEFARLEIDLHLAIAICKYPHRW